MRKKQIPESIDTDAIVQAREAIEAMQAIWSQVPIDRLPRDRNDLGMADFWIRSTLAGMMRRLETYQVPSKPEPVAANRDQWLGAFDEWKKANGW